MGVRISEVDARLDAKPWGGTRLRQFGFDVREGQTIGEALITAGDAVVTAGHGCGRTLDAIVAADTQGSLGSLGQIATGGRPMFPLLAKIIDARQHLSIQVHPNDEVAGEFDKLGKTEAWHVLAAETDAMLFVGLAPEARFEDFMANAALLDGSSAGQLRRIPAVPGETILLPAGTIHALGAGVMIYEIQQPSDITYRLDDWGRVDADGNPREVHLDAGFAVSRPEFAPAYMSAVTTQQTAPKRSLLTACRYFALERIEGEATDIVALGTQTSPTVVTMLSGAIELEDRRIDAGATAIIWPTAQSAHATFVEAGSALVSWVPDLISEVVKPALAAGASVEAIGALGGDTEDVATALSST